MSTKKHSRNKNRGFLLAEALLGIAVLAIVITAAAQTMGNAQAWTKRAERNKGSAEEAEWLWLEIQTGQPLGRREHASRRNWSVTPVLGPQGLSMLDLSNEDGEHFYAASPN